MTSIRNHIALVCVGLFLFTDAFAEDKLDPASQDDLHRAEFAEDFRKFVPQDRNSTGLGVVLQDLTGWGLVYSKDYGKNRRWWSQAIFKKESIIGDGVLNPSPLWESAHIFERDRFQFLIGADQIFHFTKNPYWGFLLGLGAGFNRSRYESTFYSRDCARRFCTSEEARQTKVEDDTFAFVFWRAGIALRETRFWGSRGDINLSLVPVLARWPKRLELTTPDGHVFAQANQASFLVEALVPF